MKLRILGVGLCLLACGGSDSSSKIGATHTGGGSNTDAGVGGASMGVGGSNGGGGTSNGTGGACVDGRETCSCYGNGTCDNGLVCASNLCVRMNSGGAGNGTGGTIAGGAGGAAGSQSGGGAAPGGAGGLGGVGGAGMAGAGTGGRGTGGAPQCSGLGTVCSNDPTVCCLGLTCVVDVRSPSNGTCATLCNSGRDCASGCCAPVSNSNRSVCAPAQYCAPSCRNVSAPCLDAPGSCCSGTTCAYDDPSETTASCAANCLQDLDCVSGCCAALSSGVSVCSDPAFCGGGGSCLPAGTRPCALGTPCCPGTYCISDSINQICLPTCFQNSDCSTGCCAAPNGNGVYVCTDPGYCP